MAVFGGLKRALVAHPRLSDRATVLSSTNLTPTLPASNLQLYQPSDVARGVSAATSIRVDLELPQVNEFDEVEVPSWDLVALLYNNAGTGGTLRVVTATSAGNLPAGPWTSDTTVDAWPVADQYMANWRRPWVHSFVLYPTLRTEPFVGIIFDDADPRFPAGWTDPKFLQAGRAYVAKAWQPPRHVERGYSFNFGDERPTVNALEGGGEVVRAGGRPRTVTMVAGDLEEDDAFDDAWDLDTSRGASGDVLLIYNPEDEKHLLKRMIYGRMERVDDTRNQGGGTFAHAFTVRELL